MTAKGWLLVAGLIQAVAFGAAVFCALRIG